MDENSGIRRAIDAALGGGVITVHDLVVTRLDTTTEEFLCGWRAP